MRNAKKQSPILEPSPERLTTRDLAMRRYLELEGTIKSLTKELDALKSSFKAEGSHATSHYVCVVETRSRTNPPSLKVLEAEYGPQVRDLCTVSEFQVVKVAKKGG